MSQLNEIERSAYTNTPAARRIRVVLYVNTKCVSIVRVRVYCLLRDLIVAKINRLCARDFFLFV